MDRIFIIKIVAIIVTSYFNINNKERPSSIVGFVLNGSLFLTLFGTELLTTIGRVIYLLCLVITIVLVLRNIIKIENSSLLVLLLFGALINGGIGMLRLPNLQLFPLIALIVLATYIYLLIKNKSSSFFVLTTIPILDSVFIIMNLL